MKNPRPEDMICLVCGSFMSGYKKRPDPCVCSKECKDLYTTNAEADAALDPIVGPTSTLTPADSAAMRGALAQIVSSHLATAHEVLQGKRTWTANQVNLFGKMLNKVVPDLNASYIAHEHNSKKLQHLSREELEALAGGKDIIKVEPEANADQEPRTRRSKK